MNVESPEKPAVSETVARNRMIRDRQKTSVFWRIVHLLGSLQLALILLSTIAIAIAIATFYESSFSAKIAQAYIYKAPWFIFWLGILCINLFAVTMTRWPWQKQHTGFIVTHYGIILLLIGAVIGSQTGFEGNVTLHKDAQPINRITTSRSILQVESPADGAMYVMPFDAELLRPTEKRPKSVPVPKSDIVIMTDAYSDNLITQPVLQSSESPSARAGIDLAFTSTMLDQSSKMPLVLRPDGGMEEDFFGMAAVALLPELPDRSPQQVSETHMVFAKFAPVVQAESEMRTGVMVVLSEDGNKVTLRSPDGVSASYETQAVIGKYLSLGTARVRVESYWPDFKMENGFPKSISDRPNNPAVLVRVEGPHSVSDTETGASDLPMFELAPNADGSVQYQLSRRGVSYASGRMQVGETIPLGWSDWAAKLNTMLPKAEIVNTSEPGPEGVEGIPGFRAWLRAPDGTNGEARWVESGSIPNLVLGDTIVRIGYGLELKPVDFTIRLKNFEVPRFEGTETPANFIATVEFQDRATGETKEDTARMNKPASWPGGILAHVTGFNYKFSQAEWNPDDLGETTLQVLYDPGWLFKWFGSLAICAGIFIMFYLRPKRENLK
jgi:hypothetical protein